MTLVSLKSELGRRVWFYPGMTDTQKRVNNHRLREVSHVPEKTVLA